jgi:hypothetical protein
VGGYDECQLPNPAKRLLFLAAPATTMALQTGSLPDLVAEATALDKRKHGDIEESRY